MKKDLADVTLIVDRSGSMQECREEAQNGVNHFIEEQKKHEGECLFSLVQFDTEHEVVHSGVLIGEVPEFKLVPRGMTALLDSVGRTINETGERLSKLSDEDRPGLVAVVIVTDGMENSSHEFTKTQVKALIEQQTKDYQWQFTFLGANQDAFHEAAGLGIAKDAAATYEVKTSGKMFTAVSDNVSRMRSAASAGEQLCCSYTDEERASMSAK